MNSLIIAHLSNKSLSEFLQKTLGMKFFSSHTNAWLGFSSSSNLGYLKCVEKL